MHRTRSCPIWYIPPPVPPPFSLVDEASLSSVCFLTSLKHLHSLCTSIEKFFSRCIRLSYHYMLPQSAAETPSNGAQLRHPPPLPKPHIYIHHLQNQLLSPNKLNQLRIL